MRYRYYTPPRSKLPIAAGILGLLLGANTAHILYAMPNYTQYYDYWATMAGGFLLAAFCFFLLKWRSELLLIPTGIFALIGCFSPNLVRWMEIALFFLLLFLLLLRLPKWAKIVFRIAALAAAGIGIYAALQPMIERIQQLSATGHATANYLIPYITRTLGGDVLCLLALLLLVFAMQPRILPGWMDEEDGYDRIWE